MKKTAILLLVSLIFSTSFIVLAQDEISPLSLRVTVYNDGSTLVNYHVESDPSKVRVDVDLFGSGYTGLIIRDEGGIPLDSSNTATGVTVDSIGALELTLTYSTSSLTTKDGALWNLNLSAPITSTITLPEGAAIFDLGSIPTNIGTINGAQYLEFSAGEVYVSYILALPDLSGDAQNAIDNADGYLLDLESLGYILIDARAILSEAQGLFDQDQYTQSKTRAEQAISTADDTVVKDDSASSEIMSAQNAVNQANSDGRIDGLTLAEESLALAESYFEQGLYVEAKNSAMQAAQLAINAEQPSGGNNTILIVGAVVVVVLAIAGYLFMQKNKVSQTSVKAQSLTLTVDVDKILKEHDTLRLEDREVIKFIAESNGEVFATEIRDRFDMPRSTAWRLIRRLQGLEIVEEVKIGNQSLVRIRKEYLR